MTITWSTSGSYPFWRTCLPCSDESGVHDSAYNLQALDAFILHVEQEIAEPKVLVDTRIYSFYMSSEKCQIAERQIYLPTVSKTVGQLHTPFHLDETTTRTIFTGESWMGDPEKGEGVDIQQERTNKSTPDIQSDREKNGKCGL